MRKKLSRNIESLVVTDINSKGMGVAKDTSGAVYFIKETIPGDVVNINVYKKRRGYFEAQPTAFLKKSPHRVTPPCTHFGLCGGCKWQHFEYAQQLKFKEAGVLRNLQKIGKVNPEETLPIMAAPDAYWYRNKLEFSFSTNRWLTPAEVESKEEHIRLGLGFHKPGRWDKIVSIDTCHLQIEPSNKIRNALRDFAIEEQIPFFDLQQQRGLLRTLMIRNTQAGDFMVLLQFFETKPKEQEKVLTFLKNEFPEITSLLYCINSKANDTIYDQEINLFAGKDHLIETMGTLKFKITSKSFYQTNPKQAYALYELVKSFAALEGNEIVYDLYSGTGTIALFLAALCKKIVGVESIPEAVEDAKYNAQINQIKNATFEVGDMRHIFDETFIEKHGKPDLIVADPPRDGMHKKVIHQIIALQAPKLIYVSCNSATQARDLEKLSCIYNVEISQAVDLFPQTSHVENVVLLRRK